MSNSQWECLLLKPAQVTASAALEQVRLPPADGGEEPRPCCGRQEQGMPE